MIEGVGALLIIVTAVLADKASEKQRKLLWTAFILLVLGQAALLIYTRKTGERESQNREQALNGKIDSTQKTLDKAQETLNNSLLAQERMTGRLEGIAMLVGKIGDTSSVGMKQLVGAINKMADTGRVGTLTKKQLCERALELSKKMRDFGEKNYSTDINTIIAQQQEMRAAKTREEQQAVWDRQRQADMQQYMDSELEFRTNYVAEAIYLRDEIAKRLPSVPQPSGPESAVFKGISGGSWGVFGGADYLERLAKTLCPK
jgi:hypothetical protein